MYQLTQGKLISMALRCDHAFMMYSDTRKQIMLNEMKSYWDEFVATDFSEPDRGNGAPSDKWRAWQEATGYEAFWSPENDQKYVDSFEQNKGRIYDNPLLRIVCGDLD